MTLDQLRYFLQVAEQASFTRAAENCSVSQPALSQQIARLEDELQRILFDRKGRELRLTAAGEVLRQEATKILALADNVKIELREQTHEFPISVAAIPTIAPYLLPTWIREFSTRHQGVRFNVQEVTTDLCLQLCRNRELDLAILAQPIDAPDLAIHELFEEELLLALPESHPLANEAEVSLADIEAEPFLLLDEVHCLTRNVVTFCQNKQLQPITTGRWSQLATILRLIAEGQGISLIPQMATDTLALPGVTFKSLAAPKPKRTIIAVSHPLRYQNPTTKEFAAFVRGK